MKPITREFKNHIIKATGEHVDYPHKLTGVKGQLEHAQKAVGGLIQFVELGDGTDLVINEEGLLLHLPVNSEATRLFREAYGNSGTTIVGDVIRMRSRDIK